MIPFKISTIHALAIEFSRPHPKSDHSDFEYDVQFLLDNKGQPYYLP
jgi:hypothetical protein